MPKTTMYRPYLHIPRDLFDFGRADDASRRLSLRYTAKPDGEFVFVSLVSPYVRLASRGDTAREPIVHDYATEDEVTEWGKEVSDAARVFVAPTQADVLVGARWLCTHTPSEAARKLVERPDTWRAAGTTCASGVLLLRDLFAYVDAAFVAIGLWVSLGVPVVHRRLSKSDPLVEYAIVLPDGSPLHDSVRAADVLFGSRGLDDKPGYFPLQAGGRSATLYALFPLTRRPFLRALDALFAPDEPVALPSPCAVAAFG